jgi:hypothetical protein
VTTFAPIDPRLAQETSMPFARLVLPSPSLSALALGLLLSGLTVACSTSTTPPTGSSESTTGTGGASSTTTGAGTGGAGGTTTTGTGTGGASDCPQADTMLDVSKAPGAGPGYPKPTLSASCTATIFVVESNNIPPYTFVQTTPNPLQAQMNHWEIPRNPVEAAQTTAVPMLGLAGFSVNGQPFFGPNEGAQPAAEAYGDPVYNGIMDPCLGHTANQYHYHSMLVKCLNQSSLVAEPWMNDDPPAGEASPVVGWAMDGFPIYGPQECGDQACAKVVEMQSGYAKIGDPKTNAWQAYQWSAHAGDATYLDACNGHHGPNGDYHYHATSGFPYIIGCYRGTPMGIMGGGMMGGPTSCTMESDCTGACPQGSLGCTCAGSPMGKICAPTCNTAADCPMGPMGALKCIQGVCRP